ncbi:MAG: carboxypeptidase-like regulatory domain-containing protein [Flavisolibacter sp.]|jgi:hypothetical protein
MRYKSLLLIFAFSAAAFVARANITPETEINGTKKNDIVGGVIHFDTKKPLANVNVSAYSTANKREATAITDDNGYYYFDDLKPGTYKLVFEKYGFKKVTKDKVTIRSDDGFQLNIAMEEEDAFQIMPGLFHFE